jgi:excinuclease ABC subunit C
MLPLDCGQDFDPARDEEFFFALPARPGIFLIEPRAAGAQPYLARTADIRRAAERLLRAPVQATRRLHLREVAARIQYRVTGSKLEQALVLYQHAQQRFPRRYRDLLRLRTPALLKLNLRNLYPRGYITRRISADSGAYFGPFPSRKAAELFAEGFLDLFKTRRCQIKIRRDPAFPGCIYSEMKMCLAPCFAGCTKEEYDVEVGRVLGTLASAGTALTEDLESEREATSEALDFERAAALHKKIEKVAGVLRGLPELARPLDELNAVILQRAAEENAVAVFAVRAGVIANPFLLQFGVSSSKPRSLEEILRGHLEPETDTAPVGSENRRDTPSEATNRTGTQSCSERYREQYGLRAAPENLGEHLALLARWFYSHPRDGEIFFAAPDWPYRRIVRACSRVLNPQASTPLPPPQPAAGS